MIKLPESLVYNNRNDQREAAHSTEENEANSFFNIVKEGNHRAVKSPVFEDQRHRNTYFDFVDL